MLNYNKLKYFTVAARHLNLTHAAAELFLSQPTLSVHIKELEKELGVTLFERANRKLVLTRPGQVLYEHCAPFFEHEDELLRSVRQAAEQSQPHLTIGSLDASIIERLPDVIEAFRAQCAEVEVELRRMEWDTLNEALLAGVVDVGFHIYTDSDMFPRLKGMNHRTLRKGKLCAVVHKSDPLAGQGPIPLYALRDRAFVVPASGGFHSTYDRFLALCKQCGFTPRVVARYGFIEPLLMTVNLGSAVAILSDLTLVRGLKNLRFVELEESEPMYLEMVWNPSSANPAAERFAQHVLHFDWSDARVAQPDD